MPDFTLVAIGCYTEHMPHVAGAGKGIEIIALDRQTGALERRHVVEGIRNPSYLALSPTGDRLYAVEELDEAADPHLHAYALDQDTGTLQLLARVPSPGAAACHVQVSADATLLFVSNFVSGDLLCYMLDADGVPAAPAQVISRPGNGTAHVHCAIEAPGGATVMVCDAGNDTIAGYTMTATGLNPKPAYEIAAAKGSFPRHVAKVRGTTAVLIAHEHSSTLGIIKLDGESVTKGEDISSLPADWTGNRSGAAVRAHPNGRFGYMSSRGHDSIFGARVDSDALTLTPIGTWKSGGQIPRDFAIDPSGLWLIAAHQNSSDLVVFAVDPETGALSQTSHRLSSGTPVAVLFLEA